MADTYVWKIGANGKPTNEYLPDSSDLPDAPLIQPYPKTMWRIVDGKPTHDFLSNLPDDPLTKPYPKTMWRIDPIVNDGKPYHEFLPISCENDNLTVVINCNKIFLGMGGKFT